MTFRWTPLAAALCIILVSTGAMALPSTRGLSGVEDVITATIPEPGGFNLGVSVQYNERFYETFNVEQNQDLRFTPQVDVSTIDLTFSASVRFQTPFELGFYAIHRDRDIELNQEVPLGGQDSSVKGISRGGLSLKYQFFDNDALGWYGAASGTVDVPFGNEFRGLNDGKTHGEFNFLVTKRFPFDLAINLQTGYTFWEKDANFPLDGEDQSFAFGNLQFTYLVTNNILTTATFKLQEEYRTEFITQTKNHSQVTAGFHYIFRNEQGSAGGLFPTLGIQVGAALDDNSDNDPLRVLFVAGFTPRSRSITKIASGPDGDYLIAGR